MGTQESKAKQEKKQALLNSKSQDCLMMSCSANPHQGEKERKEKYNKSKSKQRALKDKKTRFIEVLKQETEQN